MSTTRRDLRRASMLLVQVRALCDEADPVAAVAAIRRVLLTADADGTTLGAIRSAAGAALGSIRSEHKAATARANGARGGRPPRRTTTTP